MSGLFANLPDVSRGPGSSPYQPPVPSNDPVQRAKEDKIRSFIGSRIRVTLIDDRIFEGQFYCYDNYGHILINNTERIWKYSRRHVGIVCARPAHVAKVEVLERKEVLLEDLLAVTAGAGASAPSSYGMHMAHQQ